MNRQERRKLLKGKKKKNSSLDFNNWLKDLKSNIKIGKEIHEKNINDYDYKNQK